MCVLLPWNFDIFTFGEELERKYNLEVLILDPYMVHPANIDRSMFGGLSPKESLKCRYERRTAFVPSVGVLTLALL